MWEIKISTLYVRQYSFFLPDIVSGQMQFLPDIDTFLPDIVRCPAAISWPAEYITDKFIVCLNFSEREIWSLVYDSNPNNADDGISGKNVTDLLSLLIIFKLSFKIFYIHRYILIYRKELMWHLQERDTQLIKNYRPISLLPNCGKLYEKIIFDRLYTSLPSNVSTIDDQYKFLTRILLRQTYYEIWININMNKIHKAFGYLK